MALHRIFIFLLTCSAWCCSGFIIVYPPDPGKTADYVNHFQPESSTIIISSPEAGGDFTSLSLPLKRAGRLLLIEAVVDGVSGNLVFDTGATGLVLNRTYFRKHVLVSSTSSNGITGTAGTLGSTIVGKVLISDLFYENCPADLSDLSHLENQKGIKIIGLFGYSMIRSFEVVLDISNNELQLHRIDKKGNRLLPSEFKLVPDHVQKVDPMKPVLILRARIGEKDLNFCLDTGAETNALHNRAPKSVMSSVSISSRSTLRGAGQSTREVLMGTMGDFKLGEHRLEKMDTIIVNLEALSEAYGTHIDGMLGYTFLEKGTITINLVKKEFSMRFINS